MKNESLNAIALQLRKKGALCAAINLQTIIYPVRYDGVLHYNKTFDSLMKKDHDIHPALIVSFVIILGITVGTAVAMEKTPFSLQLDTTELEIEDLIPGRSDLVQPRS